MSEQQTTPVAEDHFEVKGKRYDFAYPSFSLIREVAKTKVEEQVEADDFTEILTDDVRFQSFAEVWDKYINLIVKEPDNELKLGTLRFQDVLKVVKGFFFYAVATLEGQ